MVRVRDRDPVNIWILRPYGGSVRYGLNYRFNYLGREFSALLRARVTMENYVTMAPGVVIGDVMLGNPTGPKS